MTDLIEVNIRWKDTQQEETVIIGVGCFNPVYDDLVFFWIDSMDDLENDNLSNDWEII